MLQEAWEQSHQCTHRLASLLHYQCGHCHRMADPSVTSGQAFVHWLLSLSYFCGLPRPCEFPESHSPFKEHPQAGAEIQGQPATQLPSCPCVRAPCVPAGPVLHFSLHQVCSAVRASGQAVLCALPLYCLCSSSPQPRTLIKLL